MAFTRKALSDFGLAEDTVDKVMTLHGTSMADFIPRSDLQTKINEAVAEAQKNTSAKDSDDYKALQGEFDDYKRKVEVSAELKKGGVKDKFIDAVYAMLDAEKEPAAQLAAIKQNYEEYFTSESPAQNPQFGADVSGNMPSGNQGPTFDSVWGIPKKG